MAKFSRIFLISCVLMGVAVAATAQVNAVEFGRNRVQYKKFKWKYIQTKNFNVYYNQNGEELAKYIAQSAEKELPQIEAAAEYSLQRRANIVLYNQYADMLQSNIGMGINWQNTSGVTKLVNNKMVVYFDADHEKLRLQVRKGIAEIITENRLFGDDLGEVIGNQTLLDLPGWLTAGYVSYLAENWSTEKDDQLKSEILSGEYKKFYHFAFKKPDIAGHAFWFYIEEKYKKENVTYLLYLATVYKNLNKACMQVCKKKFKEVLKDFMEYEDEKYSNDITKRKPYPKGNYVESFEVTPRKDYFHINVNPNKRNNSYVLTQFKKGKTRVIYNDEDKDKTLLKYGILSYKNEINPNYPLLAWDSKGTRIAVMYVQEGHLKFYVYDIITRQKVNKIDLTKEFDQVQDMKYMLNANTLLLSAVKNGHTDIYTYDIQKEKARAVTNDVYDDLDASFVAFPNKTGIIFASNRPYGNARGGDTSLPSDRRYNIFLVTDFGDKPELNQITQLTHMKYGDARMPMQYNETHFTFVCDENGISNRYAGFFTTKKAGLDTLVLIGKDILRNPTAKQVDSTLRVYKKTDVDSIAVVSISTDSTYTFPLTNYESALGETRIAGDNNQVSEVTRHSDEVILYKLKIDENTLRRRNITAQPTEYMKRKMAEYVDSLKVKKAVADPNKADNPFQTEFQNEKDISISAAETEVSLNENEQVLKKAKYFKYKPPKFYFETGAASFNNSVLINRYQPYAGGSGPIQLNSGTPLSGLIRLGTSELMEDVKVTGGFKISTDLKDNEWLMSYQNYKRRIDWGATYYRNSMQSGIGLVDGSGASLGTYPGRIITNLYQLNVSYPFDETKSIRLSSGIRSDKYIVSTVDAISSQVESEKKLYSVTHLEYVYDNTLNPSMNIWHGMRYKAYMDWNRQVSKSQFNEGPNMFNFGFDFRYYYPIYRNFIWAGRAAGDFSWGNQKIVYYLGGEDGWVLLGSTDKIFNQNPQPANDQTYAFQSLAVNMRGYKQNIANGNNAVVINSEFRLPVFSTLANRTINNAFLRNLQVVQFVDFGTAWNGSYNGITRPSSYYTNDDGTVTIKVKAGGVGPFAGGYGFGVRSTLLGYFMKFDAAWPMNVFFKGKPMMYLALGLDF